MPTNVAAVKAMSWDDMQALFAATYADEIAAIERSTVTLRRRRPSKR
jgi:hypothetical protein